MDTIVINDYDQPQQDELAEELDIAAIGAGEAWQLDNIICHEGCVILEFLHKSAPAGSTEATQDTPTAPNSSAEADVSIAMVNTLLDQYRIIFQTSPDTGVVIDLSTNDATRMTTMTVTAVQQGIIISRSVNVSGANPSSMRHRWTTSYSS